MNCTRCHAGIPDDAKTCPQCGSPTAKAPFFEPDQHELQQTKPQTNLLIGCAFALGALMVMGLLVAFTMFALVSVDSKQGKQDIARQDVVVGAKLDLYGKTINDEDFNWESLRGKIVLVKFTATWCGYCHLEIPGMKEAYKKYQAKGFEIISVYVDEREPNAVTDVKQLVDKERLPWIILSESLTIKAGQPPQGENFGIRSYPTMLLVDREGKVHSTEARGEKLKRELVKLFEE